TKHVRFEFAGYAPERLSSYRGYYEDLAIVPNEASITVLMFREMLLKAVGETFEGYKGGGFVMHRRSRVWVAPVGTSSGTAITGILNDDYTVWLQTTRFQKSANQTEKAP